MLISACRFTFLIFHGFNKQLNFFCIISFAWIVGTSEGVLPHASQQGILHPYRTYADITLFHFSVPPELARATWEFVAFMDGADCPSRDVHIYLQHGSYPVISADNASFPNHLYLGRSSLHSTVTQATFHGLGHRHSNFEHRRSVIPIYSPLPGDWFVAAFLSNWDQQLTQQGIGHKCHYSLFSVVLWSTDTVVEAVTPGVSSTLMTRQSFSYFKFYVSEGAQHLSVIISQCQLLVDLSPDNSTEPCLSSVSIRPTALPLLPSMPVTSFQHDPYDDTDNDARKWGMIAQEGNATLVESRPHTDTYYYLLVVAEAQAKFTLVVNISECQKFDLRKGWVKLLNSGFIRRPGSLTSFKNDTSYHNAVEAGTEKEFNVSTNSTTKWLLDTGNVTTTVDTEHHSALDAKRVSVNWTVTEEVSEASIEVTAPDPETVDINNCWEKHSCIHTFQLTRIQHSQDFSSTFLLQVEEFFVSSILLPDEEAVLVRLDILPFLDIGGSLSIDLHLDRMLLTFLPSFHLLNVRACVRKGRPPPVRNAEQHMLLSCPDDLSMSLSSQNRDTTEATLIIPFPEPGPWFIAIQASCTNNGSRVPCIPEELGLDLDIRIQPCVFAGDPCGSKGECERTHHGLHTFSSCVCFGGYAGWGCTDGRRASAPSRQLVGTLALTLSNLFFMPAVVLAAKRRLLAEALIYLATTLFSTLYHACDEPEYSFCVTKYEVLQFCDFFCSILAFWVTLVSLACLPPRLAAAAHMAGVLVVAVGVEWNRTALVVFLVPVALGLLVPVVTWAVRSWHARNFLGLQQASILRLLPGVLLAALGLGLFAMVETEANYQFIHSAWHMLMGLALLFLLPESTEWKPTASPSHRCGDNRANNPPLLDASSQELCDVVNDYYATNPVFVLTSNSSHQLLITSES